MENNLENKINDDRALGFEQIDIYVNSKRYVLQKMPIRPAMKMREKWVKVGGAIDDIVMADELLANVVVSPKVKLDDFTDYSELDELITKALLFQFGSKEQVNDLVKN